MCFFRGSTNKSVHTRPSNSPELIRRFLRINTWRSTTPVSPNSYTYEILYTYTECSLPFTSERKTLPVSITSSIRPEVQPRPLQLISTTWRSFVSADEKECKTSALRGRSDEFFLFASILSSDMDPYVRTASNETIGNQKSEKRG